MSSYFQSRYTRLDLRFVTFGYGLLIEKMSNVIQGQQNRTKARIRVHNDHKNIS